MCDPAVVRTPLVQNKSLIASGMPSSAPASPVASRASDAAAISSASSGVVVMKALSGFIRSTTALYEAASSRAENCFAASPSRASASVRSVRLLNAIGSLDHLGHGEEAAGHARRIGEDRGLTIAVGDNVLAHRQGHRGDAGHRRDVFGVDRHQLLDPIEDAGEFGGGGLQLLLGGGNAA